MCWVRSLPCVRNSRVDEDSEGTEMTILAGTTTGIAADAEDRSWAARGACVSMDPDEFFVQGAEQHAVKTTCGGCPVRTQCLVDALENRIDFGVWGGMTERERRRLLRRHPDVVDWSAALAFATRAPARGQ